MTKKNAVGIGQAFRLLPAIALVCLLGTGALAAEKKPRGKKTAATAPEGPTGELTPEQLCAALIGGDGAAGEEPLRGYSDLTAKYKLLEFFNPNGGLAVERPLVGMNAAHRLLSLILSEKVSEHPDPDSPLHRLKRYEFFTAGGSLTQGRRVVDRDRVVEAIVSQVREQAASPHGAGAKVIMVRGTPATGKSEVLEAIRAGYVNVPRVKPEYQLFTFRWKNLGDIAALKDSLPDGATEFVSPLAHSPVLLLPEKFRAGYLKRITPWALEHTGVAPQLYAELNPQDKFIYDQVLLHETKGSSAPLSENQALAILNKYVDVIPLTEEMLRKKALFLPRQSKPVNYKTLLWMQNPAVSLGGGGPSHPFAHHITGSIPMASDGVVLLDEFGKNEPDFLDKMLTFFQSRRLADGGMTLEFLDVVIMTATNDDEINEIKKKHPNSALISRMAEVPSYWSVRPASTAAILAYEGRQNLQVEKLPRPEADARSGHLVPLASDPKLLDELFPENPRTAERVGFPDGRYALWYGSNAGGSNKATHISPYAMLYLTSFVALTRSAFNAKALEDAGLNFPLLIEPVFRDRVGRLRYLLGKGDLSDAHRVQMATFRAFLSEGSFGIDHRKVTEILPLARDMAEKAGTCITPRIIRSVLEGRAQNHTLAGSDETAVDWVRLLPVVEEHFVVPGFQSDVRRALLGPAAEASLRSIYRQLILEMGALGDRADATEYVMDNIRHTIDRRRLADIQEIYRKSTGKSLDFTEISRFHAVGFAAQGDQQVLAHANQGLIDAILTWQQVQLTRGIGAAEGGLATVVGVAADRISGSDAAQGQALALKDNLIKFHGYCPHCARESFLLVDKYMNMEPRHQHAGHAGPH